MKKIIAMLIVLVGFLAACTNQTTSENSTGSAVLDRIYAKKKIVIGTTADYPPFEWHYINDGKDSVVGIDIDIANAIGEALGVEVEIREMEFNFLIAAMKSGKVDLVLAGITPTEERSKEVAFTNIYYDSHMVAVVKKTDASKFTSLDSFNGANVGAQKGTSQEGIVKDTLTGATLTSQPKNPTLILALQQGKLDAVIMDNIAADEFVKANSDLTVAPVEIPSEDAGTAAVAQKGNEVFVQKVQEVLDQLESSGKLKESIIRNTNLMSE